MKNNLKKYGKRTSKSNGIALTYTYKGYMIEFNYINNVLIGSYIIEKTTHKRIKKTILTVNRITQNGGLLDSIYTSFSQYCEFYKYNELATFVSLSTNYNSVEIK